MKRRINAGACCAFVLLLLLRQFSTANDFSTFFTLLFDRNQHLFSFLPLYNFASFPPHGPPDLKDRPVTK